MPGIWETLISWVFCLHGGLSPLLDTLDNIRALDCITVDVACNFKLILFSNSDCRPTTANA
jgi:diadenosine tetraphosphatase ApaH/serine/threonine PP2A family protein phosphatase